MTTAVAVAPPAYLNVPERRGSLVDEVGDLAVLYGRPLDSPQQVAVDCLTSYRAGGLWAALENAVLMARQNGKTGGILTPIVLDDLFLGPPDRIVWTAHLFKTARAAFEDCRNLISGCDELSRRVRKVREANGEEGIVLTNGAVLDFLARSKGGGRGLGGKTIVLDEGLFLPQSAVGALFPVLAARDNPRLIVGSSAAVVESEYLRSLVARGRRGGPGAPALAEWCAPGSFADPRCTLGAKCSHVAGVAVGCVLDREDYWRAGSPAAGVRVGMETLRSLRAALPWQEFAREFLGWHEAPAGAESRIPAELWAAAVDELSRVQDRSRPVFVLDVSPDRATAAIGVAGRRADGRTHVGVARHGAGDGWVVGELKTLLGKHGAVPVAVDGASPAAALLAPLEAAGVTVQKLTLSEIAQACGSLETELRRTPPGIAHRGDPLVTGALAAAAIRDVGDGAWAWARRTSEGDITPLVVVTLAAWLEASRPSYDLARSVW